MTERSFLAISHGSMAIEAVKSLEMLMGPQNNIAALGLQPGESVDGLREQATKIIEKNHNDNRETIVCVDLLGGSPSNVSLSLLAVDENLKIITGLNLPLLVNLLNFSSSEEDTDKLITQSVSVAKEGLKVLDKSFLHHSN